MTQESLEFGAEHDLEGAPSAPDGVLDSPEVQDEIGRAQERIKKGKTRPGKTSEDLLNAARDRGRVDARPSG